MTHPHRPLEDHYRVAAVAANITQDADEPDSEFASRVRGIFGFGGIQPRSDGYRSLHGRPLPEARGYDDEAEE